MTTTTPHFSKEMPASPVVAVVGATGAVGREMLATLESRAFPASRVIALASARSAGTKLPFNGPGSVDGFLTVEELTHDSFEGVDIALFSAGASISKEYAADCARCQTVIVDNSSAFRMDEDVPLVVPEVNAKDAYLHRGVIANPNCSTIQMVVALAPLRALAPIKRVVVSTYQAASGAGAAAMQELYDQTGDVLAGKEAHPDKFVHQIAFNCIPHIDIFLPDRSTKEEWKMVVETKKIMHDDAIAVSPTCVRVPVLRCHSEAINVEFTEEVSVEAAREAFENAPGVTVLDDPATALYPMPYELSGTDDTYVGRLRKDETVEHGLNFWIVADQLRKGAALNTVQIAELLVK